MAHPVTAGGQGATPRRVSRWFAGCSTRLSLLGGCCDGLGIEAKLSFEILELGQQLADRYEEEERGGTTHLCELGVDRVHNALHVSHKIVLHPYRETALGFAGKNRCHTGTVRDAILSEKREVSDDLFLALVVTNLPSLRQGPFEPMAAPVQCALTSKIVFKSIGLETTVR